MARERSNRRPMLAPTFECQPDPDRAVAYGLFSLAQAQAAGHSSCDIRRQLRREHWRRVERGILCVNGREARPFDPVVCAALRAGPAAAASHETAALVRGWELVRRPEALHLTVPRNRGHARGGTGGLLHHSAYRDVEYVGGILPVTAACRTALDLTATLLRDEAVVAVDSALRARAVTLEELAAALRARGPWKHARRAAAVLDLASSASCSVPETQARLLFLAAGLPTPVEQFEIRVDGRLLARVDFAWLLERLIVEIDGYAHHNGRGAFERDRRRQNDIVLAGWTVLRFTPTQLRDQPAAVAAAVRQALGCV